MVNTNCKNRERLEKITRRPLKRCLEHLTEGKTGAWIQQLARLGYLTRGAIFLLVGLLALQVAAGLGGRLVGTREVIQLVGQSSLVGRLLLGLTTVGMSGYTLWRFLQAALDLGDMGGSARSRFVRKTAFLGSGFFYATLTLTTAQLAAGSGSVGAGRQAWTAWALSLPFGAWAVGLIGAVLVGAGLHAGYRAYRGTFMHLYGNHLAALSKPRRNLIRWMGRVGLSVLGLTLLMIGVFVVEAALFSDPASAVGIGGALGTLLGGASGPWMLGAAGLGFVAYGFHCIALGRHRVLIEA